MKHKQIKHPQVYPSNQSLFPIILSSSGLKETIPDLWSNIPHCTRSMWDENGWWLWGCPNLLHSVKILSDQHHIHDILGCCSRNILREGKYTVPQPINNCLALASNAKPWQIFGLCFSFSSLDLQYFIRFSLFLCCQPLSSSCDDKWWNASRSDHYANENSNTYMHIEQNFLEPQENLCHYNATSLQSNIAE